MFTFVKQTKLFELYTMINNEEFTNRLQRIIDYYGESASSFAEKIGVQRSSISHILSGRNKPSLEFVLRVINTFTEVDIYWLLFGKGNFPLVNNPENTTPPTVQQKNQSNTQLNDELITQTTKEKSIEKIVFFYEDGTFKIYKD